MWTKLQNFSFSSPKLLDNLREVALNMFCAKFTLFCLMIYQMEMRFYLSSPNVRLFPCHYLVWK